jgi:ribosome-associated toxin RatA of RatAB toxin-antitoxin module
MPIIEITRVINAPIDKVVEIARDVEAFPDFMPDVKALKVIEKSQDGTRQVTEWTGIIKQFAREIKWTQEDIWIADENRIDFRQIRGDYDKMEGDWKFSPYDGGTRFVNYLDYEYRVPLLGALVSRVVDYLVRQNLESIMDGIQRRAGA